MPATNYVDTHVTSFAVSEVQTSARGAKHAGILAKGGSSAPWVRLPAELRAPFGATSWEDEQTGRRNLDLTDMPEDLVAWLETLDAWAVDAAARDSERLFRKKLSREDILGMYTPVLKPGRGDWAPTLRLK